MKRQTTTHSLPVSEQPNIQLAERIAKFMDARFKVPGTRFRFGLDPILGLVPVVGDLAGFAVSGALILYMLRFGASRKVITLMLLNTTLDATIGSIPVLGWVFDAYYKANQRNIRLLKEHYNEGKHQGSGKGVIIAVAVILLLLIILMLWGLIAFSRWIWGQF